MDTLTSAEDADGGGVVVAVDAPDDDLERRPGDVDTVELGVQVVHALLLRHEPERITVCLSVRPSNIKAPSLLITLLCKVIVLITLTTSENLVVVTIAYNDRFFCPKKDLLTLKIIRYCDNRPQWHFLQSPPVSL